MKKKIFAIFVAFAFLSVAFAAPPSKDWFVDYAAAVEKAKAENKPLLVLTTGSDWCPYCIKLEKDVLKSKSFKELAKKSFVLVYLDFPRRATKDVDVKANRELMQRLKFSGGLPEMRVFSPEGAELGVISGYAPEKVCVKKLKSFLVDKKD